MLGRNVFPRAVTVAVILAAMLAMSGTGTQAQEQAAPAAEIHAKGDITGDWQGTLEAGKSLRIIAKFAKNDKGAWGGQMYSIDQTPRPFPANPVTVDGATVKFTVDMIGGNFTGTLSADCNTIAGSWAQGPTPLTLTLVRATKETAWEIPAAPPPVKRMPADASPSFDVATIKPNDKGATSMQQLTVNGRNFQTRASSVEDLICFAYDVQKKQIVNAPDWIAKDRYDIAGVPDVDGAPSVVQLKGMVQKLLADRFKLTFHHDKRELSAFVLTVAKTGQKLTVDDSKGPLPGFGFGPSPAGLNMMVQNASMKDFSGVLQSMVLDRPVVDQTALDAKYDFTLKFTPDDSQFNGHPPPLPAKTDTTETSPSLFEAMQQQLGLKLDAQRTAVDVLAVDRVEKPTGN